MPIEFVFQPGSERLQFSAELFIFDKDGTLIDFNFMWASWVVELASRLERGTGRPLAGPLYAAMGYDAGHHTVIAGSPLAAHSMSDLFALTLRITRESDPSGENALEAVQAAWFVPDPVAMARPLADLPQLFSSLREMGLLIGVATSDDRVSSMTTLRALGVIEHVNVLVSADDGLPNKPAPDMLLKVCSELGISPAASVMIGDSVADMEAARRAGIGTRVGVLSGVSARELLEPHADVILASIEQLPQVSPLIHLPKANSKPKSPKTDS